MPSHFDAYTLVFNLRNLGGSKIFNLNKFGDNLDVKAFLNDNYTFPRECTDSPFLNKDDNHNMTFNLKSINQNKLHQLFSEDSKYREYIITDYLKTKKSE